MNLIFLKEKLKVLISGFKKQVSILSGSDRQSTIDSIYSEYKMRGSNIWFLFCSAILASVGLDVNSPAIIIGAMLISPLMSPILSIGLSLGTLDRKNFFISIREFIIAFLLSLLISTVYFLISPLGNITDEILARIKPTALDIIVAFFGGVAGIIAVSRSKITSAIPGVAIATALMPPVCTAGFGIAKGNLEIFLGAGYLFFINAVFISAAVFIIVRWLKFPFKSYADVRLLKRAKIVTLIVVFIIALPSFFIFYKVIQDISLNKNIERFIRDEIQTKSINVIKWEFINNQNDSNYLYVYTIGEKISTSKIDSLSSLAKLYGIEKINLRVTQINDEKEMELFKNELKQDFSTKIKLLEKKRAEERTGLIDSLEKSDSIVYSQIKNELKIFFPQLINIGLSKDFLKSNTNSDSIIVKRIPIVTLEWARKTNYKDINIFNYKINDFIKQRLKSDTVIIVSRRL